MAIYAIGDIQGCYNDLCSLLDLIKFDPAADQLWLAGDLVNRGPNSLETLRFIKSLGDSAISVLGNHDLHLIATVVSNNKGGKKDTLDSILRAEDCEELIDWLRNQRLFYYNDQYCMLHAGLPPQWDFQQTRRMAQAVEQVLRSKNYRYFFRSMYGNKPSKWQDNLPNPEKLRFAVNCFTRLRYCTLDGELDFHHKGPPGTQATHLMPWFMVPGRKSQDMRIIFGHWSTLGLYQEHNVYAIDTGCLWGGQLTALKLDEPLQRISIECHCKQ